MQQTTVFKSWITWERSLRFKCRSTTDAADMLKRRLKQAGLPAHYSPHSFRATGITNFLENDGTLEAAQRIAGHADSRTTKLYDRRGQKVLLEDRGRPNSRVTSRHFAIAGPLPSSGLGVQPFLQLPKMRTCNVCFADAIMLSRVLFERSVTGELRPVVFWDSVPGRTAS
jgi:hypothetical protein